MKARDPVSQAQVGRCRSRQSGRQRRHEQRQRGGEDRVGREAGQEEDEDAGVLEGGVRS